MMKSRMRCTYALMSGTARVFTSTHIEYWSKKEALNRLSMPRSLTKVV